MANYQIRINIEWSFLNETFKLNIQHLTYVYVNCVRTNLVVQIFFRSALESNVLKFKIAPNYNGSEKDADNAFNQAENEEDEDEDVD